MAVRLDALGADHHQPHGFIGSGPLYESISAILQPLLVSFIDGEGLLCVFHFAKVDCVVVAFNHQIDL